jgi:hypothetical protein
MQPQKDDLFAQSETIQILKSLDISFKDINKQINIASFIVNCFMTF